MDGTAIKELHDRFGQPSVLGDGLVSAPPGWTITDQNALIKAGPKPETLDVYSLSALVDYVKANRDSIDLSTAVVHIVSPQIVTLNGPLQDRTRHREVYVKATANNLTDGFLGKFMPLEDFVIGLQTRFVDTPTRTAVIKLLSNVKSEQVQTSEDDGISQTVNAKVGIVLVSKETVPNPIELAPYRTFREVDAQPTSVFVLRLQSGRPGGTPDVALFEADGGAWRLDAIQRVHDVLKKDLGDIAVLA